MLFGFLHIYMEINVWRGYHHSFQKINRFPYWILLTAFCFSIVSMLYLAMDLSGKQIGKMYPYFFLGAFGIWILFCIIFQYGLEASKLVYITILIGACTYLFILASRPSLLYFFLVHFHNFIPWIMLYGIQKNKRVIAIALLFSVVLPVISFIFYASLGLSISEIALPERLEVEIFRQILSQELEWITGTTFLGYFAYQQILHYILWIFILPLMVKRKFEIPALSYSKKKEGNRLEILLVSFGIVFALILFCIYPIDFRRTYFAFGFFHIAMEYPLLTFYLKQKSLSFT